MTEIIETAEEEIEKATSVESHQAPGRGLRTGERPVYMGNRYHVILISGRSGKSGGSERV
jgi:hypothetical protein